MAFGQAAGPPASARQLERLGDLLRRAGYESFREARHPFGLNQRQAAGRFSVAEADELIERLEAAETVASGPVGDPDGRGDATGSSGSGPSLRAGATPAQRPVRKGRTLSSLDDAVLVRELERRGWCCIPPIDRLEPDGPASPEGGSGSGT